MSFASTPSPNWPPSPLTQRLRRIPAPDSARVLNELRLHVLVNLVGHTAGSRHVLTQWQPAPVQALHYGYPATSALPAMGYMQVTPPPSRRFPCPFRSRRGRPLPLSFIIHGADGPAPLVHTSRAQVDRVSVPPAFTADFTERLAYFPHCHFVAVHASRYPHVRRVTARAHPWHADRRVRADDGTYARRSELGLGRYGARDGAFALCNFNQLYKMDPETFEAWANALRRLPGGFLWLTRVSVRAPSAALSRMPHAPYPMPHATATALPVSCMGPLISAAPPRRYLSPLLRRCARTRRSMRRPTSTSRRRPVASITPASPSHSNSAGGTMCPSAHSPT